MIKLNELYLNQEEIEVLGVKTDSRLVNKGDLFVCIKGYTVDGHDFAQMVQEKGACAIVAERALENISIPVIVVEDTAKELARICDVFYKRPSSRLQVHGVTGTNGKTTTAFVLSHLLNACQVNTGYIGTNGIIYNDTVKENKNTTPESLTLQSTLNEMLENGVKGLALEVSSHALALNRTAYTEFKSAIFTNLTPEHLDFHSDMEDYYLEKKKLFSQLKEDGVAIINIDDEYGERLAGELEGKVRCLTFGVHGEADFKVSNIRYLETGTEFEVKTPTGSHVVGSPLIGEFNVYNVLGAMISAYISSDEVAFDTVVIALKSLQTVDGRMELINEGQDFTVIVDYAHTPDGVEQLLKCASKLGKDKLRLVIGCPGDRDRTKRPVIAKLATDYADEVIFTTDDPHSEEPEAILDEMLEGLMNENYQVIVDRKTAIKQAVCGMKKNEMLIIAGRGHQKLQYWSKGNVELDDREVTREFLKTI